VLGEGTKGNEGVTRLMEGGLGDGGGGGEAPLLERYVAMALGNRGRAVLLLEKRL